MLEDYDPEWPKWFERAERSRSAARSVTPCCSSNTSDRRRCRASRRNRWIDIDLVVADTTDESGYVPQLEAVGYILRVREPDWYEHRMLRGHDPPVNLHVFPAGCEEVERMLVFRDRLRSNAEDRELYERTKRELAAKEWKYVQNYADAKTEVVRQILERA